MSNYIVDELVLSIFNETQGLQVVERSQLQAVFDELALNQTGVVDLSSANELGKILGVDALVVGSVTTLGDQLRIFARLIDTETATVFAGAATTVPNTDTIKALAGNRTEGCSFSAGKAQSSRSVDRTQTSDKETEIVDGNLAFRAATVRHHPLDGRMSVSLQIENISDGRVRVSYAAKTTSGFDDAGQSYTPTNVDGITYCDGNVYNCSKFSSSISPGEVAFVTYTFYSDDRFDADGKLTKSYEGVADTRPRLFSMSSNFWFWETENGSEYRSKSVGFNEINISH